MAKKKAKKKASKKKVTKKSKASKKKVAGKREVGKQSGLTLAATWAKKLKDNKTAKLTDDQLRNEMAKEFPSKKDKTTVTRVSMIRGIYNKGTNMFAAMGPASTPSVAYDEDGAAIAPRSNSTAAGGAKKKASKKKAKKKVKKKVAKKKKSAAA